MNTLLSGYYFMSGYPFSSLASSRFLVSRWLAKLLCCHIQLLKLNDGGFCLVNYTDSILCLRRQVGLHRPIPQNYREKLRTIGWDIFDHTTGQFEPSGRTVRYLCPKCLLDTSVLMLKCPDTSDPSERY